MKFNLSNKSLEILKESTKNGKPKSAIQNSGLQKKLLLQIRDIEKKIKLLSSQTEKATLLYEIGLIWRDQIGDMRSAIINFQKSYEEDSTYLPNLKAVRDIFIEKKNWDFVLDIIETELNYIDNEEEKLYLLSLKAQILIEHKNQNAQALNILIKAMHESQADKYSILKTVKSLYIKENRYHDYGELIDSLISKKLSSEVLEIVLIDIITLYFQKKYKPSKDITEYIKLLMPLNTDAIIPHENLNWNNIAETIKEEFEAEETFNSNKLYLLYRIYKDILKNYSEANKILIANYHNIKNNFLLLNELENHYADNYNWEKLIDIQKKKLALIKNQEERSNIYYKIGSIFQYKIERISHAKKYFQKSLDLQADNLFAIKALSKIAYLEKDVPSLVKFHLKELDITENENLKAILYFKIAEIYLNHSNYKQAESYYIKSKEMDTNYYPPTRALLKLYRANKQWKKVIQVLNTVIKQSSDDTKKFALRIEIGKLYLRRILNIDDATKVFKSLMDDYGYSMEVFGYLEEIYRKDKNWDELIKLYTFKIENIHDNHEKINILMDISELLIQVLKKHDQSIEYLKQVLEISPNYIPALQKLSSIYKASENWEKMIELNLNEMDFIQSNKKKSMLLKEIADTYKHKLKNLNSAMEYYESSLEFNAYNFEALTELEYIYNKLKLKNKLINLLLDRIETTKSLDIKSDYSCKIAEIYLNQDNTEKTIQYYKDALSFNKENKIAFEELKRLMLQNKEFKKLISLIESHLTPDDHASIFYMGQLNYLYVNNTNKAEILIKKALSIKPLKHYYKFLIKIYIDTNKTSGILKLKDQYLALLSPKEQFLFSKYIISLTENNPQNSYTPIKEYMHIFNYNPKTHFFYNLFNSLYKNALWTDLLNLITIKLHHLNNKREEIDLNYHCALIYEYYQKDYESALEFYEKVIKLDNNHFLAIQGKNRLYKLMGNVSGIVDMLNEENYENLLPEVRKEMLYKNSLSLIEDFQKYEEAETLLFKILKDFPSDNQAFDTLYDILVKNYKYQKAIQLIENKIPTINDLTYKEEILIKKSELTLMINPNDIQDSIKILKEIIKVNPNNLKAKINLIDYHFRVKNYRDVITLSESVVSKNIGAEDYQKILYYLFKSYYATKHMDRLISISDMLLERKLLSFDELEILLPLYKKNKSNEQVFKLLLILISYDSNKKIDYIIEYLDASKKVIDQERWHEKILHWIQTTKSIELLNYYTHFFIEKDDYQHAISILEENLHAHQDKNIKSSIFKKIADLKQTIGKVDDAIEYYKKAVRLNNNLSALNKIRKIFSSNNLYIKDVLEYYPELIANNLDNLFLVKDLFYIYNSLDQKEYVYTMATIINSCKLESLDAKEIYQAVNLNFPKHIPLYQKHFSLLASPQDNQVLRDLFFSALSGLAKLSRKTTADFPKIEKVTAKNYYMVWDTFNKVKTRLDFDSLELYIDHSENTSIQFIYPDPLGIVLPSHIANMDQEQLSYFLAVQMDRLKSMNFLLQYHSVESVIKFMKVIINFVTEKNIFVNPELENHFKLFSKTIPRTAKKKLQPYKNKVLSIAWDSFDFKQFISSSYKTSLNIGLITAENINIVLRAILKERGQNNILMSSEELIQSIKALPELEELYKYLISPSYNALIKKLGVTLVNKNNN